MAKYLNLGCGNRYVESAAWLNVDFAVRHPGVLAIDLRKKLPFGENSFDLVYHSHVLEHFTCAEAKRLLDECYRVLKPGGIIRIVVPDLENIVREYLHILDEIRSGVADARSKYDWIMLELYDQVVRQTPGGMMLQYLQQPEIPAHDYVLQRGGKEIQELIQRARTASNVPRPAGQKFNSSWQRLKYHLFWRPKQWIRRLPAQLGRLPSEIKEKLLALLLAQEYELLTISRFRNSGEVHQWMYDSYSLGALLAAVGFTEICVQTPTKSYLDDWPGFHLDTEPDGRIYKPNSLYMEAKKMG
ncbi:class I SAM-dependent methyltransferase [Gloeomargarita sp.]